MLMYRRVKCGLKEAEGGGWRLTAVDGSSSADEGFRRRVDGEKCAKAGWLKEGNLRLMCNSTD